VPQQQGLERRLVAVGNETLQQLPVRQASAVAQERGPAQVPDDPMEWIRRHRVSLFGFVLYQYISPTGLFYPIFFGGVPSATGFGPVAVSARNR
jgi:hypothetical protein